MLCMSDVSRYKNVSMEVFVLCKLRDQTKCASDVVIHRGMSEHSFDPCSRYSQQLETNGDSWTWNVVVFLSLLQHLRVGRRCWHETAMEQRVSRFADIIEAFAVRTAWDVHGEHSQHGGVLLMRRKVLFDCEESIRG